MRKQCSPRPCKKKCNNYRNKWGVVKTQSAIIDTLCFVRLVGYLLILPPQKSFGRRTYRLSYNNLS